MCVYALTVIDVYDGLEEVTFEANFLVHDTLIPIPTT